VARQILYDFRVDWDINGSYTNETTRLISASGEMRLAPIESTVTSPRGIVDRAQFVLNNYDGRYSPLNSAGSLYSSIANGGAYHAPCYLRVSIDNGANYHRVFTGVIKIPDETGPTWRESSTVTIEARSREEELLNRRTSTLASSFSTRHDSDFTEAEHMGAYLSAAGYSAGTDYELDAGLFVIPWAWLDDESPVEEIWRMAAACGGRFYTDPDGVMRYENMAHWLGSPHDTVQETFEPGTEIYYESIQPYYNDAELFNAVTVEISERDLGVSGAIWQADRVVVVPAGATKTITARLRQPVYTSGGAVGYAFTAVTGGGSNIDADITVTLTSYAQRVSIEIENGNATYAANLVSLQLTGTPVDGRPSSEESAASVDAFWSSRQGRTRAVTGNVFIQTHSQAATLAAFLRDRYELPRLFYKMHGVPGDPARRLGDRIEIDDPSIMTTAREAFLTAIAWKADDTGFGQEIEAMDSAQLFPDAEGYFILGTHHVSTDDEVVFY
jgi:hypothetical protein